MEKILLALDSRNVDIKAIQFACYLAQLTNSKLTGVFLEDLVVEEEIMVDEEEGFTSITDSVSIVEPDEENIKTIESNIRLFADIAAEQGVDVAIDLDQGIPAVEIISKTRFADVLVVDASSFSATYGRLSTGFLKDILQDAECPVIIAPENFRGIDNIIFCYTENKSSAFALKQFTYLFPQLRNKTAKIIYLTPENKPSLTEEQALTDWLKYHYSDVDILPSEGDAIESFFSYMLLRKKDLVVMGSYGRGLLASFFESYPNQELSRTTSLPVFVAHY